MWDSLEGLLYFLSLYQFQGGLLTRLVRLKSLTRLDAAGKAGIEKKDKPLHYFETFLCSVKCQWVYLSKKSETGNTKSDIFSCASCEAFCHYENTSQLVCFNLGLCTFCILWHFSKNSSSLKLFKQNFGTLQRQRSLTNRPIHLYLIFEKSSWKNQVWQTGFFRLFQTARVACKNQVRRTWFF